ncbi:peptidoglycan/LPS O-acetylase OafA/YrhL [Kineococcus xinjiangensis]|uniref:Peptidoglycan/LPS O-acetylase OafA/YrhL n=2 Tax=Kineococcus xinjiangensis TaxID=512762 RepID=A0A2S6ICP0_9ACTN|nr:peptidoglycan/LPS O-acetylase OafA/YrhL [Kineococcus xinjiangensis]
MDALRLLAALAVVLFHFTARDHVRWGPLPVEAFPALSAVTRYGYAGVHLFFVISGFVILMSAWGRSVPQFVASRVSRLFPAYWAAVLLTATLRWAWPTFGDLGPVEVLVNLTMLQDLFGVPRVDGVYWTLWVELQFYLAVLLLLLAGPTRRRVLACAGVGPVLCTALTLAAPAAASAVTLLGFAPLFAAGMVLYVLHRDGHTGGRWLLLGLNAAQAVLLAATRQTGAIDHVTSGGRTSPVVLALVVAGCIGLVAAVALVPVVRDLDLPLLTALGALTYPLYLTHEYVGWALIDVLHTALGRYPTLAVALGCCIALAWALHRLVERPLQKPLRTRLEKRLGARAAARAG